MTPLPHPHQRQDLQPLFSGTNDSSSWLSLLILTSAAPWGRSSADAVCGHRFTQQTASQAESTSGPWDAATHSRSLLCSMATMQLILPVVIYSAKGRSVNQPMPLDLLRCEEVSSSISFVLKGTQSYIVLRMGWRWPKDTRQTRGSSFCETASNV